MAIRILSRVGLNRVQRAGHGVGKKPYKLFLVAVYHKDPIRVVVDGAVGQGSHHFFVKYLIP
jgi:hypothetical protein